MININGLHEHKEYSLYDYETLRSFRNAAGEYMAVHDFAKSFEALRGAKAYIKRENLPLNTFDMLLNEVVAIGVELSADNEITAELFSRYLVKNAGKLIY